MPAIDHALIDRLNKSSEITITVTGRKSGRAISIPIWFALDRGQLHLLPVEGSETQWYKNMLSNPAFRIKASGSEGEFKAVPITDSDRVSSVVEEFRAKYGAGDVKKYYKKFDVAVIAQPR